MSFLFKNYSLAEVAYLLTRFKKTKSFPGKHKKYERNDANESNTHTYLHTYTLTYIHKHTLRNITLEKILVNISDNPLF